MNMQAKSFESKNYILNNIINNQIKVKSNEPNLELIELCASGEISALKTFFELYSKEIYNFPLKVFHLDEDAASDFFIYAYERLKNGKRFRSYKKRSSFRTWFYAVLRNLVIDWMRTIKEINYVDINQNNNLNPKFDYFSNLVDPKSLSNNNFEEQNNNEFFLEIKNKIKKLPIDLRLVFKISFIYYLELDVEEINFICELKKISISELNKNISELRNILSIREIKNLKFEDKITALYLTIINFKNKINYLKQQLEQISENKKELLVKINNLEQKVSKKLKQHQKLIDKKNKGHFISRTPYKYVAEIIEATEANISVQMMRCIEKLKNY